MNNNNNDNYNEIREKFFDFLLRKPSTQKQANEYLSRLKVPENYREVLMNEAENLGLIDDFAFARLFVDGHLTWGNAKISYELGARGVPREYIRAALDEADDEAERAAEIAEDLRRSGIDEKKIRSRLISRGFFR